VLTEKVDLVRASFELVHRRFGAAVVGDEVDARGRPLEVRAHAALRSLPAVGRAAVEVDAKDRAPARVDGLDAALHDLREELLRARPERGARAEGPAADPDRGPDPGAARAACRRRRDRARGREDGGGGRSGTRSAE